jgi:hypothetical protein
MTFDQDDIRQHFGHIYPIHVVQFCELLVSLRRLFGGDLDLMLVLAVIGTRYSSRRGGTGDTTPSMTARGDASCASTSARSGMAGTTGGGDAAAT